MGAKKLLVPDNRRIDIRQAQPLELANRDSAFKARFGHRSAEPREVAS